MKKNLPTNRHAVPVSMRFGTDHRISRIAFGLFLIQLFLSTSAFSQEYLWHKHFSGSGVNNVNGWDIAIDAPGNTYVVGRFGGTVNFGGQTITSTSPLGDIFFAKYNSLGTLIFVNKIGAVNGSCSATGVALYKDASNNVFLFMSGYISSGNGTIITVDFNPTAAGGEITLNDTDGDAFVAKYNVTTSTPTYVWATRVANSRADYANGGHVATDASGNLYMASTNAGTGAFLRKYSASAGAQVFANNIGSNANANGIAFNAGNIYVCGFGLTANARPIAWYNTSGTLVSTTGATNRSFQNMTFDNSTGLYGVGGIVDVVQDDVIIEKYTTTTSSAPVWSKTFNSGITGASIDIAYGGSTSGDLMVTGWFKGTVNFNNPGSAVKNLTSSGSGSHDNIFVARYLASNGTNDWVKNNTSSTSSGQSNPIALATWQGSVNVLSNVAYRTINAGFCISQTVNADNGSNSFIASYTQRLPAPVLSGPTSTLPGEPEIYDINPLVGANTYEWMVPPGWTIISYDSDKSSIYVNVGNNSGNVQARAFYDCGSTSVTNLYVTVGTGGGGGHLASIYPNPAAYTVNVDVESFTSPTSVTLLDASGNVLKRSNYSPTDDDRKTIELDISSIPSGLYFVRIANRENTINEQISIAH